MRKANPKAVAERYLLVKQARKINAKSKTASRVKTAGEVRFIKDHGDDLSKWADSTLDSLILAVSELNNSYFLRNEVFL